LKKKYNKILKNKIKKKTVKKMMTRYDKQKNKKRVILKKIYKLFQIKQIIIKRTRTKS